MGERGGRLDVRAATYGTADAEWTRPETLRFVTSQVRALVERTARGDVLCTEASFNALFGDPVPNENKVLKIYYEVSYDDDKETSESKILVVPEGSTVLVDVRRYAPQIRRRESLRRARSEEERVARLRSLSGSAAARAAKRALETEDVLRLVLGFLPLYPDRLRSMAVCRAWRDFFVSNGLADRFSVGVRGCKGVPCYLDLPLGFVEMVLTRSAPHLVSLDLAGFERITDEVLAPALRSNPQLRALDLSGCSLLTTTSLGAIGTCCGDLASLSLKRLEALDDACVVNVAQGCKNLESLDLSDCINLTDTSIRELGPALRRLRVLHAKDLYKVTDESVRVLLENCGSKVETLSLWSMNRISKTGLEPLGGRCPRLASLNLSECFALDDDALVHTFEESSLREIADACASRTRQDATLDLLDMRGTPVAAIAASAAQVLSSTLGKDFEAREGLFMHAPQLLQQQTMHKSREGNAEKGANLIHK
ncbi:F-box/LRR-repeat protein 2 [Hondaea fermentalgiana]|uniref:F-box/LRR-repeat protein 2 n=1 Tax=Hondaea fermentalgiana TaxID=2315210 RepID=A0A2R5GHX3_9STRA|nr:F-box/LRR-repeat protein 2 [Hondaea fermentalgiana]|eukprot:GBG30490.1 F-box/LRR-repeat protein 2 [Hondaea fermentalgiana]